MEQSGLQSNANEGNGINPDYSKNEKIVERIPFKEGSVFTMIRTESGCFGALGKHRITEIRETMPEVEEELGTISYDMIWRIIIVAIEDVVELKLQERIEKLGTLRERVVKAEQREQDEIMKGTGAGT